MSFTIALDPQATKQFFAEDAQPHPKVVWLGKTVHQAQRTDTNRIMAMACIILLTVGLLLLKFAPIIAVAGIGIGLYLGYAAYQGWRQHNYLETALQLLLGGKEKIDRLPQTKITKDKVALIKPEDMKEPVMRVAVNGETYGVAFKCTVPATTKKDATKTLVKLYLFKEPFETSSASEITNNNSYSYCSRTQMTASEGRALQTMFKAK